MIVLKEIQRSTKYNHEYVFRLFSSAVRLFYPHCAWDKRISFSDFFKGPLQKTATTVFIHCLSAEDFTLEKIIELGLDQFAEQISEVSGAASKELSIEQVGLLSSMSLALSWKPSGCLLDGHSVGPIVKRCIKLFERATPWKAQWYI